MSETEQHGRSELSTRWGALRYAGKEPATGLALSVMGLAVLLLIGALFSLAKFSMRDWGQPFNLNEAMTAHATAAAERLQAMETRLYAQHLSYEQAVRMLTYVTAVCLNRHRQIECENLDLDMPDELRKRHVRPR